MNNTSRTPSFLPQNPNFSSVKVKTAGSIRVYNTADQTTNFERLTLSWASDIASLFTTVGGSGVARTLRVGTTATPGQESPGRYVEVQAGNGASTGFSLSGGASASSGTQTVVSILAVITQSGTAGYTALDVNPTESSTGSGTKLLQRWAVGGTQRGCITSDGFARFGNSAQLPLSGLESTSLGLNTISISTSTTLTSAQATILVDATSGALTQTLPAAAGANRRIYIIKKIDSSGNTVTIDGNASETIDGALTKVLSAQYDVVRIQSDGSNWHVI